MIHWKLLTDAHMQMTAQAVGEAIPQPYTPEQNENGVVLDRFDECSRWIYNSKTIANIIALDNAQWVQQTRQYTTLEQKGG
jgi:hypothetical protein